MGVCREREQQEMLSSSLSAVSSKSQLPVVRSGNRVWEDLRSLLILLPALGRSEVSSLLASHTLRMKCWADCPFPAMGTLVLGGEGGIKEEISCFPCCL